ncbi:hypothetical protein ZWY2020_024478 [Hordeum vulgare]|nr:hypothetical protein ZWY2020_024478 [Hordeum vulgare]
MKGNKNAEGQINKVTDSGALLAFGWGLYGQTSASGAKATLNDKDLGSVTPGSLLSVTKQWNSNDHLSLQFPIALRTEAIKDDRPEYASLQAILFGPFVLAGLSSSDCDAKTGSAVSDWITEHPPVPLQLTLRIRARAFVLGIHEFDNK